MTFDPDLTACADLVARADSDRFAATMAAPVALRRVLFPIYAFNVEVSRAPWVTQEPMIAEMRLQWWADALTEIETRGAVRRHEIVTSLAHVLTPEAAHALQAVVSQRQWDIYREPFADDAAFISYLEGTSAALFQAAALSVTGARYDALTDLGIASGLARFLCAVPALERQGRLPLVDGRPEAVRALARRGLAHLHAARSSKSDIPSALMPICYAAWQAAALLGRARSDPARVAGGTLALSEPCKKFCLIWTAATGRW